MSAGLTSSDSMFSVRATPWHGLGAVLDRPPASVAEAIEAAGLGWSVVKKPLVIDRGPDWQLDVLRYKKVHGYYATVRQDTEDELGVCRRALPDRAEPQSVRVHRPALGERDPLRDGR